MALIDATPQLCVYNNKQTNYDAQPMFVAQ